MEVLKLKNMKGGWFIGNFNPTAFKTKEFEVSYKEHPKGEQWDYHYHKEATEINLLVEGHMTMCGKELKTGDVFVVEPMEVADPVFHEDCKIICVKTPSVIGDKYLIDE